MYNIYPRTLILLLKIEMLLAIRLLGADSIHESGNYDYNNPAKVLNSKSRILDETSDGQTPYTRQSLSGLPGPRNQKGRSNTKPGSNRAAWRFHDSTESITTSSTKRFIDSNRFDSLPDINVGEDASYARHRAEKPTVTDENIPHEDVLREDAAHEEVSAEQTYGVLKICSDLFGYWLGSGNPEASTFPPVDDTSPPSPSTPLASTRFKHDTYEDPNHANVLLAPRRASQISAQSANTHRNSIFSERSSASSAPSAYTIRPDNISDNVPFQPRASKISRGSDNSNRGTVSSLGSAVNSVSSRRLKEVGARASGVFEEIPTQRRPSTSSRRNGNSHGDLFSSVRNSVKSRILAFPPNPIKKPEVNLGGGYHQMPGGFDRYEEEVKQVEPPIPEAVMKKDNVNVEDNAKDQETLIRKDTVSNDVFAGPKKRSRCRRFIRKLIGYSEKEKARQRYIEQNRKEFEKAVVENPETLPHAHELPEGWRRGPTTFTSSKKES